MVKTLIDGKNKLTANKIVKTESAIIGYDINGNQVFKVDNIIDFTKYSLVDENNNPVTYDIETSSNTDLQTQIYSLTTQLVDKGVI